MTRLQKLLKHQKEGQERMKIIAEVQVWVGQNCLLVIKND